MIYDALRSQQGAASDVKDDRLRAFFAEVEPGLKAVQVLNKDILACFRRAVQLSDPDLRYDDDKTHMRFTVSNRSRRAMQKLHPYLRSPTPQSGERQEALVVHYELDPPLVAGD